MTLDSCIVGDCREGMKQLIAEGARVQTIVTSPPYFGLRDYGTAGQIGLENTPEEYVSTIVEVFALARQLLADSGTLWLNLGDCYAGSGRGGYTGGRSGLEGSTNGQDQSKIAHAKQTGKVQRTQAVTVKGSRLPAGLHETARQSGAIGRAWVPPPAGLKHKDLIGIPWMVAFALRADGWYLRSDIIWSKPNPMPESVTDRPTKAHEYIFLLTKSRRYFYDAEAIKEPAMPDTDGRYGRAHNGYAPPGQKAPNGILAPRAKKSANNDNGRPDITSEGTTRNKRSVWTVPTSPFPEAHFAVFPEKLIEPCVLAGSRPGDIVFDPFMGAGTVAAVATRLGRHWLGCEINPEYVEMHGPRIAQKGMAL